MADYYSLISRAVSGLLINTDEARRESYDRARTALKERLRTLDLPISETQLRMSTREEVALSTPSSNFISGVKEFARSMVERFNDRVRWSPAPGDLAKLFWKRSRTQSDD